MFDRLRRYRGGLAAAGAFAVTMSLVAVAGANAGPTRPIAVNQTDGYAQGQLTAFTYFMNFDCVEGPFEDLDHNNKVMAADPAEVNGPHCVAQHQPPLGPTGDPIQNVEKLFVIVPFFETDPTYDPNANGLGPTLKSIFGFVPDAFKTPLPVAPGQEATDRVAQVQCPEPGPPLTQLHGDFGTCTTHTNIIDLGPLLTAAGKLPPNTVLRVPTPNHSHIIRGADFGRVWWQVVVNLVTDKSVWPDINGTHGLTSVDALRAAQAKNQVSADIPTNFFLFFSSQPFAH